MSNLVERLNNKYGTVYLHEILKAASKIVNRQERIDLLKLYEKAAPVYGKNLRFLVECLYHPLVKFNLAEGVPKYKPLNVHDETMAYTNLLKDFAKVKYFCSNSNDMVKDDSRREILFIQLLEELCPHEAKLLIGVKDKKLDKRVYPLLDESLFREAFPLWLPLVIHDSKN